MEEPTNIEVLRAVVSDLTPISFTSTCEIRGEEIIVTLCLENDTRTVNLSREFEESDSDALTEALRMPMHKAYLELSALHAKKPARKKAKKRKGKKAKRAKKTPARDLPASSGVTPAAAGAEASAAPASTITNREE